MYMYMYPVYEHLHVHVHVSKANTHKSRHSASVLRSRLPVSLDDVTAQLQLVQQLAAALHVQLLDALKL